MPVKEAALDGFRGGLAARRSPLEFGEEQWAKLLGFVVEDGGTLRSQWPLQEVKGVTDVEAFGIYQGPSEDPFLVVVLDDGSVKWRAAPPDEAETGSDDLDETWHDLLNESGNAVTVASGVRPITTIPLDASKLAHATGGLRPAMILNSINISDAGLVHFVYESDSPSTEAERLRAMNLGSSAKWPEDDETDASPKGEHGVIWSGVLVLGDIEWKADPEQALSSSNKTRYRNGLWLSIPGEPLLFDPLSVLFIGDPNTRISGLLPTEQGLLVFTTSEEAIGGVHVLRGTPDAFTLEPLHIGIGVTSGQTIWQDTNTFCWVTDAGEVWQTDTDTVRRLDRQGLGVDRQKSPRDGVRSFGPWLVVVRERRMFALRALDDGRTAAWTELSVGALSAPPDMQFATETGQALYFNAGGKVYRFTRADIRTGASERGLTPTGNAVLSVGTRTLATGEGHAKTFWHRVGVRATAGRRAGSISRLESLVLRAGPVLDNRAPSLIRPGPFELNVEEGDLEGAQFQEVTWGGEAVSWGGQQVFWDIIPGDLLALPTHAPKRWQAIVRGIGASNEFSAEVNFRGDVQVEQVSVWFNGSIIGGDEEGR